MWYETNKRIGERATVLPSFTLKDSTGSRVFNSEKLDAALSWICGAADVVAGLKIINFCSPTHTLCPDLFISSVRFLFTCIHMFFLIQVSGMTPCHWGLLLFTEVRHLTLFFIKLMTQFNACSKPLNVLLHYENICLFISTVVKGTWFLRCLLAKVTYWLD